ncbi:MAG: hypothetical protein K2J77_09390 [Oscillospiraceae bacterium]|nr:hypothetical protein [Oscillospiraceae bacterium]
MKRTFAIISLIVLNALVFFAGICAAFSSGEGGNSIGAFLWRSAIYLAAVPAPLALVWGVFRDVYGFRKLNFYLCTLLPPFIISSVLNIVMVVQLGSVGSQNGGYAGLALIALIMANSAATFVLTIDILLWTMFCELVKSDRAKKVWAIILLGVCGTIIFSRLRGLLEFPFSGLVVTIRSGEMPRIVSDSLEILCVSAVPAVPLGFGVATLMRFYREKYSLKPPLFMLLAFAPTLLISGVLMAAQYSRIYEYYYFFNNFTDRLETVIFTAIVAIVSAIIYAISALIRSKRHYC